MDYNTDEQEIDLKDLMFAVFHKWRPLILVAVICGLLLGGIKGIMTYKKQSDPKVRKEADLTYSADLESTRRIKILIRGRLKTCGQISRTSKSISIIRSGSI